METVFKENNVFRDLFGIALILGFLYFITRFSNVSSELTLFTDKSSYFGIFNLATILEKKVVENLRYFFIVAQDFVFFKKCDFLSDRTLREKGFNSFQKQFLIVDIRIITIVVIISLQFTD